MTKIELTAGVKIMSDVRETIQQRGQVHGDYTQDAATAVATLDLWMQQVNWLKLDAVKRHSLIMNAFKVSRILNGDPEHKDHWHDIAGYATLAEDRCK